MNNNEQNLEGPRHREALELLGDLAVLLAMGDRMAREGKAEDIAAGFDFALCGDNYDGRLSGSFPCNPSRTARSTI
jgi:hypothetical protein